jgi:excisionase family DNA binding protein
MAQLLTITETANHLGLSISTVKRFIATGKIPVYQPSKRTVRINAERLGELVGDLGPKPGYAQPAPGVGASPVSDDVIAQIMPELVEALSKSPSYGTVGISMTFHDGKLSRISSNREVLKKV